MEETEELNLSSKIKYKTQMFSYRCLNFLERFWRKETIRDLNKKLTKNPNDTAVQDRLDYENKMLEQVLQNQYANNIADIIQKMQTQKWY